MEIGFESAKKYVGRYSFLFSNSPPFYPYYMYLVTNRIELDLHRNWVSRIQIWWISQPYFCGPPLSIGIQKMEHHRGYDNNGRNTARSTRRIIGSWNNAAFRHILISNSTFFWPPDDGQGVRRKLTRMFLIDFQKPTWFFVEKLWLVNKPFYEESLNDSPSLFRSKLFFFGRNAFCNMMAISKAMGLMNQTT